MNPEVHPLRLNLDPIFATQRPFFFYAMIAMVNVSVHGLLKLLGFRHLSKFTTPSKSQHIYYRKARRSLDPRTDGDKHRLPIIFVHGIGIGFAHYLGVILSLPRDVDVFLVEWPYVSMQMATSGPTAEESVQCIVDLLENYHHPQACFLAHSLGTVLVSWMMHDPVASKKVAHSVLLDPIIFLLCDPTVAAVFVYKDPQSPIDLLMHFFLSRYSLF